MGGKAAINFSLAYPQRTKALVLADVAVDGYIFKEFLLGPISATAKSKGIDSANQQFLDNPVFATAKNNPLVYQKLKAMILSYSGWQWLHPNPVVSLNPPAIEQLSNIHVPTLIITGEKDNSDFQAIAALLYEQIHNSQKRAIGGAGHMCNMEAPAVFNAMVLNFLESLK